MPPCVAQCAHATGAEFTMKAAVRLALLLVAGVAVLWTAASWTGVGWQDLQHIGEPRNVLDDGGTPVPIPTPDGPAERRLAAVPVTTAGQHEFLFIASGEPVRYDPCRAVGWVINTADAPAGSVALVHQAMDDLERFTGLDFEYQGETSEVASFARPLFQDRYGGGFAPIIVGFGTEETAPDLVGSVTGIGGSTAVSGAYGDGQYLRSGVVIVDADDVAEILEQAGGEVLAEAIMRHELGHVVGLAHVGDAAELMHSENLRTAEWGPGDRQGLAIAGDGPCEPA